MFEKATRLHVRWNSQFGAIDVEDLWDLSVQALDEIYKRMSREAKALEEESLLTTRNRENEELALKIDIVKHIVSTKLAEAEARKSAAQKKKRLQKLLAVVEEKQDAALLDAAPDELQAEIDALKEEIGS